MNLNITYKSLGSKIPFAAPSTAGFAGISPLGARHGCRASAGGQDARSADLPAKPRRAGSSGNGSPFLWLLSFGDAKESKLACRCENRLNIKLRDSDSLDFTKLV
ncbi:hypothetical protein, partial [Methylocucumis oryzae]|uniref:hypothetical protein n=1 Tax=Methylocucumis oryzae TaxID=1632867 RepID=UPI00195526BE